MKIEVLGSGGAVSTPKPFCDCDVCTAARRSTDPRISRTGPSVYVHGPNVLIDTPEEIKQQLNRSSVTSISACLFSHWHPDHTIGRRFLEHNIDWVGLPPNHKKTRVVVPETVARTFERAMAIREHFDHYVRRGIVDFDVIGDDQTIEISGFRITPVQLAINYVFGYEIASDNQRIFIVMDELKGWMPSGQMLERTYDLVYLPIGVFDVNPITGERLVPADHPMLSDEQSIGETIDVVRAMNAGTSVLSHVEEPDGISFELAGELSEHYTRQLGREVIVAHDTMAVDA